jgi:hypothetical protein
MEQHKVKVRKPDGTEVDGVPVTAQQSNEPWSEYLLEDGTVIRIKQVLTRAVRLAEYDGDDNPVYLVQGTNVMVVSPPENLKRPRGA